MKKTKKLRLHRETLRNLSGEDLERVQGGYTEMASACFGGCGDSYSPGSCPQYCVEYTH